MEDRKWKYVPNVALSRSCHACPVLFDYYPVTNIILTVLYVKLLICPNSMSLYGLFTEYKDMKSQTDRVRVTVVVQ